MGASKRFTARGPQNDQYSYRTKRGVFEWGGMDPDSDPGAIAENRFRLLINARFRGGSVVPRGGQVRVGQPHAGAAVKYLDDFQLATKRSLYVVGTGLPGFAAGLGMYLGSYDFDQSPAFASLMYSSGLGSLVPFVYGDDLLLGYNTTLKQRQAINADYGVHPLSTGGLEGQDRALVSLPAGYTAFSAGQEFDGLAFLACVNGASSAVMTWDGKTLRVDVSPTNPPTGFGLYRELLIMGFNGTPNQIWYRGVGASPGSWTTVAPGAGTASFKNGVSFRDLFYFTTGGEDLYSFNGTALTRIVVGTSGIVAGSVTDGICVMNGRLYVSYTTSTNTARIASFDGTTWTGTAKNLTAQTATVTAIRGMVEYRGSLRTLITASGAGSVASSPVSGGAISGTWTYGAPELENGGIAADPMTRLVVY